MPSGAKYKAKQVWYGIADRFKKKLATWKRQYLSVVGRIALINNMLDSLPTYLMSLSMYETSDKIKKKFPAE